MLMESIANRNNNASKESYIVLRHDTSECCTTLDAETRADGIDQMDSHMGEIDEMVKGTGEGEIVEMVNDSAGRTLMESEGHTNIDPCVGMEFESEEAVKIFYSTYALHVGFGIRVGANLRSKRDGTNIGREFVCSREGFRAKKYQSNRQHTRIGCKAMIKVKKKDSGKWIVSKFVKDHNHALETPKKVHIQRLRPNTRENQVLHNSNMGSTINQINGSNELYEYPKHDAAVDVNAHVGEIDGNIEDLAGRTLVENEGPLNVDPYVGMEFESEETTKLFYAAYAKRVGFSIRISANLRSKRDGKNIGREFVCSREGFRAKKYQSNRPHTRQGCKAMIKVKKKDSGKWVLIKFVKDHNHALGTPKKVHVQRSHPNTRESRMRLIPNTRESQVLLNIPAEFTTNQTTTSKESFVGSKHDSLEYCRAMVFDTHLCEMDKIVEDSVQSVFVGSEGLENIDPFVGMEFESEEATKIFYNAYAQRAGFSIRVGANLRSKRDGSNIGREFVCSKEGFRAKKYRSNRPHTREGCKAMFKVKKKDSGKWVVSKFVKEHNHALVPLTEETLLRSQSENLDGARTAPDPVMFLQREQFSGPRFTNFTLQDPANYVQSVRKRILKRDTQHVLEYFKHMQAKNPSFFYAIQVDQEYHVTNIFWSDARSRMAYNYFGDVVTFDTTYTKNLCGMPMTSFLGVNHHKQSVLFGCALLLDETEASFVWLFNTWLEAMSGRHPVSLITDQDPVLGAAIARVFPRTRHRFSKWHIIRKLPEKLGHVEHQHINFKEDFFKCITLTETNDEFESCWWSLIDKYGLRENEWLQALYRTREQWVQMYFHDAFLGKMSITQQSEIANLFFDGYVDQHNTLPEFVHQCKKALDNQYEKELEEDFKTSRMKPIMKTGLPMENQAAEIYTRSMFVKFQEELFESLRYLAKIIEDGPFSTFRVVEFGEDKRAYAVTFNVSELRVSCTCQMFEYTGILCRHILIVFRVRNVMLLPSNFILKRWTRNATCGPLSNEHVLEMQGDCRESRTLRYNDLCHQAINYAAEGATNVDIYNVAVLALRKALEEVVAAKRMSG